MKIQASYEGRRYTLFLPTILAALCGQPAMAFAWPLVEVVEPLVSSQKAVKQSFTAFNKPHYKSIKLPRRQQWPQHRG